MLKDSAELVIYEERRGKSARLSSSAPNVTVCSTMSLSVYERTNITGTQMMFTTKKQGARLGFERKSFI